MQKILFVTYLKKSSEKMSSTDIMTRNLLSGLQSCGYDLTLLALYDSNEEIFSLQNDYEQYTKSIVFCPRFFNEKQNKYYFLLHSFLRQIFTGFHKRHFNKISSELDCPDVIISNKITLDEILYGFSAKKIFKSSELIQYWSDPMTLSAINIDLLKRTPRRWPFLFIESMALRKCDRIVYGTKPLMDTQKKILYKYSYKMTYVDVCYTPVEEKQENNQVLKNRILYAGNYYSSIRNILPLAEAVSKQNIIKLDVYGDGDVDLSKYSNVNVHGRVTADEIEKIESNYSMIVCVLNHTATQIPGKIFYDIYSYKKIFVLVDGPYQDEIIKYLMNYCRFIVCRNKPESIISTLNSDIIDESIDLDFIKNKYSPKSIAECLVNGGLSNDVL